MTVSTMVRMPQRPELLKVTTALYDLAVLRQQSCPRGERAFWRDLQKFQRRLEIAKALYPDPREMSEQGDGGY